MKNIWAMALNVVMRQGLSVTLLALAVWWFNDKNNRLENRVEQCNGTMIQIYSDQNERLLRLIESNTAALDQNSEVMKNLSILIKRR